MNVARVLYPVKVLGPGMRLGIWLAGCPRRCEDCSNPELWEPRDYQEISVEGLLLQLNGLLENQQVDGITITGGDPFYQAIELAMLLQGLNDMTQDILVYTGYMMEELQASSEQAVHECLKQIGVLIDGPYMKKLNYDCLLRGSENQRIYIFRDALKPLYEEYLDSAHNEIQNFTTSDGTVSVGIHKPGFKGALTKELSARGIRTASSI